MSYAATPELEAKRRQTMSVQQKERALRDGVVAGKRVWTDEERAKFKAMWLRDATLKDICKELDKTVGSVKGQRLLMDLPSRRNMRGQRRTSRLNLQLTADEMEAVRRAAHYHRRTVWSYLKMLLRRDGAL